MPKRTRERSESTSDTPCYVISVAAKMVGVHVQTLRYYERAGLVKPSRSRGNIRLYSQRDVERLRRIKSLQNDLGVNLAGVDVIMRMSETIASMEQEMEQIMRALRGQAALHVGKGKE